MSTTEEVNPPEAAATDLVARCKRFAELTEIKRGLDQQLRTIQDQLNAVEEAAIDDMALAGVHSLTVDGMTVYRQREFYARRKEGIGIEHLVAEFAGAGLSHMLGLSWQTLKAAAREWAENEETMPQAVKDLCDIGETTRLRCRKQ